MPRPETIQETEQGIVGKGPSDNTVGINYGLEPPNALVQLGFLYAGMLWPFLDFFHEANKIALKMWREETKALKEKQNAQQVMRR